MGTKMKILLRLLFLFIPFTLHAQSDWVKEAKGVALCECIKQMNMLADSTTVIIKDYSISYFIQMTDLPPQLTMEVVAYVKEHYKDYISIPQEIGGNMIGLSCWEFYHSKALDDNIRKIVSRYKPARISKGRTNKRQKHK